MSLHLIVPNTAVALLPFIVKDAPLFAKIAGVTLAVDTAIEASGNTVSGLTGLPISPSGIAWTTALGGAIIGASGGNNYTRIAGLGIVAYGAYEEFKYLFSRR